MNKEKGQTHIIQERLLAQNLDQNYHPADAYALYNKRTGNADDEFIEHCNQNMDSLLVFSGLFSAVTVALIVESYKGLREDPQGRTEQLLEALIGKNGSAAIPPQFRSFSPPRMIVTANILLFLSLSFALFAALGALLVKEWARQIFKGLDALGSPQTRAREHFQRVERLKRGLVCWLHGVNPAIYLTMMTVTVSGFAAYLGLAVIPAIIQAPSKPLLPIQGEVQSHPLPAHLRPIVCTPLTRVGITVEQHSEIPDELDYKILIRFIEEADTLAEWEAAIDSLRDGLALVPSESKLPMDKNQFTVIVQKAASLAASCRSFRDGHFDIHPGISLERVTMIMQFFDLILQVAPEQTRRSGVNLVLLMNVADLLLERAMQVLSLEEIALHASVVARLGYQQGDYTIATWHSVMEERCRKSLELAVDVSSRCGYRTVRTAIEQQRSLVEEVAKQCDQPLGDNMEEQLIFTQANFVGAFAAVDELIRLIRSGAAHRDD
ncbi:12423_t:CDS:2 [Acaulospora colombiana]|uniref:12423_t:CDS:1 n=1 Tax=Acaulospora colombiana TaxID=27376 RepID=A0ACA9PHN6_9GLOM|nr:12423_t:CDS:2 [Acaulospora colombiana]